MRVIILILSLIFCSSCASVTKFGSDVSQSDESNKGLVFAGAAVYLPTPLTLSEGSELVLDSEDWHLYELTGYFLPSSDKQVKITVAERARGMALTSLPWLVRLRKVKELSINNIPVDYIIESISLGESIFCPSNNQRKLFIGQKPAFESLDKGTQCYRI